MTPTFPTSLKLIDPTNELVHVTALIDSLRFYVGCAIEAGGAELLVNTYDKKFGAQGCVIHSHYTADATQIDGAWTELADHLESKLANPEAAA